MQQKMKHIIPLHALSDNYIWMMIDPGDKTAWVVDPGAAAPVQAALSEKNLRLEGILITHHHADHVGGVLELLTDYPKAKVYGSKKSELAFLTKRLVADEHFSCGKITFRAIAIPGHTLDHMAYYDGNVLFSGDTLFSAGCGRVFEGSIPMMYASLQKLAALPLQTKIFCGHEYTFKNLLFAKLVEPNNSAVTRHLKKISSQPCTLPSTLLQEKEINPFLRCDMPTVISAAEKYTGQKNLSPVEVFGVLREWKNSL